MDHRTIERFWAKVDKSGDCWEWTGAKSSDGYGSFHSVDKVGAHRFAWFLIHGAIPLDKQVLHKCDNPACVCVDHLYLGTRSDNMQDALRRGRLRNYWDDKTHCKRGHPFSGSNLGITSDGRRRCKACKRIADQRRYATST